MDMEIAVSLSRARWMSPVMAGRHRADRDSGRSTAAVRAPQKRLRSIIGGGQAGSLSWRIFMQSRVATFAIASGRIRPVSKTGHYQSPRCSGTPKLVRSARRASDNANLIKIVAECGHDHPATALNWPDAALQPPAR